ncbi:MAG TPA: hypothetical protein VNM91_11785 [Dehalococcoidia bacterium]|nr:hypothetical protein [Dehalococcoidia bacterium]
MDGLRAVTCSGCGKLLAERDLHNLYVKRALAAVSYGIVTLRCPDDRCRASTTVNLSLAQTPPVWVDSGSPARAH